jgi:hypothetical protein
MHLIFQNKHLRNILQEMQMNVKKKGQKREEYPNRSSPQRVILLFSGKLTRRMGKRKFRGDVKAVSLVHV